MTISCPLCNMETFRDNETLFRKLISAFNSQISCPLCHEHLNGLDKLGVHLEHNCTKKYLNNDKSSNFDSDLFQIMDNIITHEPDSINSFRGSDVSFETATYKAEEAVKSTNVVTDENWNINNCNLDDGINNNIHNEIHDIELDCNQCSLSFKDNHVLTLHKELVHCNDANSADNAHFPCQFCKKVFKMKGSLMVHLRVVHYGSKTNALIQIKHNIAALTEAKNEQSELENKPVDSSKNDNKNWTCESCKKSFTTKYFLKKHKRLHTGETPYCCELCNKNFTFQQSYHKHLLYHKDEKPHMCSECGRSFKELSTLHNHERIHSGEKPFACETCGKCFRQRVSYLVHRRIHTGVLPYKCTACEKSFRYKVSQRTHKCTAQPPGVVIRQSVNILEKLMKNIQEASSPSSTKISPITIENTASSSSNKIGNNETINDDILINNIFETIENVNDKDDIMNYDLNNLDTELVHDAWTVDILKNLRLSPYNNY